MCTMCEYVYKVQLFLFVLVLLYYFSKKISAGDPSRKKFGKNSCYFLFNYLYLYAAIKIYILCAMCKCVSDFCFSTKHSLLEEPIPLMKVKSQI